MNDVSDAAALAGFENPDLAIAGYSNPFRVTSPRPGERPGGEGLGEGVTPLGLDALALRREQRREEMQRLRGQLQEVSNAALSTTDRIERLVQLNTSIMIPLMEEMLAERPDEVRSVVCARAAQTVKATVEMVHKKAEVEQSDAFNPKSVKFQVAFGWFLELFHFVLKQQTVDETLVANVFAALVEELPGFEDKLERRLRRVSTKIALTLESPFGAAVMERIQR